jgi:hypothetical protein
LPFFVPEFSTGLRNPHVEFYLRIGVGTFIVVSIPVKNYSSSGFYTSIYKRPHNLDKDLVLFIDYLLR